MIKMLMIGTGLLFCLATCEAKSSISVDQILNQAYSRRGTPYAANTLVGDSSSAEQLVCREDSVDCMTFLALCISRSNEDAPCSLLQQWRYKDNRVSWQNRRHFFSDWAADHDALVDAGQSFPDVNLVTKTLNERTSQQSWLPGLARTQRDLWHVSATQNSLDHLRSGDLIGFWTNLPGLDVTHVGIIHRVEGKVMLIHASSRAGKVIEEELIQHPKWKNGLLVLRWEKPCSPGYDTEN